MRFLFPKNKKNIPHTGPDYKSEKEIFCTIHSVSETGPVRAHNEDSISFTFPENDTQNLIAAVADGMGGHNAGEVASKMACEVLILYCLENWEKFQPDSLLRNAMMAAHEQIIKAGNSNPHQQGMGTTLSGIIIKENLFYIGHIGDSRIYLLRNGILNQLSTDHTLVNQMYESGEITEKERDQHPMKNVLLQALGTTPTINPQISPSGQKILKGDRFLLCSDGVYDALSVQDIEDLLLMQRPEFIMDCLSTMAISRNVSDNFSALLIDISSNPQHTPSSTKEQNIL